MTIALIVAVHANFGAQQFDRFTVRVFKVGNGSGTVFSSPPGIDCGDFSNQCIATFERGTPVTLRPVAQHGPSRFAGWQLATGSTLQCPATRGDCNIIVLADSTIQAQFIEQ